MARATPMLSTTTSARSAARSRSSSVLCSSLSNRAVVSPRSASGYAWVAGRRTGASCALVSSWLKVMDQAPLPCIRRRGVFLTTAPSQAPDKGRDKSSIRRKPALAQGLTATTDAAVPEITGLVAHPGGVIGRARGRRHPDDDPVGRRLDVDAQAGVTPRRAGRARLIRDEGPGHRRVDLRPRAEPAFVDLSPLYPVGRRQCRAVREGVESGAPKVGGGRVDDYADEQHDYDRQADDQHRRLAPLVAVSHGRSSRKVP